MLKIKMIKTIDEILKDVKAKESALTRMIKYTNTKSIDECWEWLGALNEKGYAVLGIGGRKGKNCRVSRLSYYFNFGAFNEKLFVCHKCDNPSCVNPNHLFLGSAKDNTQDMLSKQRGSKPPTFYGKEHSNHKLTDKEVYEIHNSALSVKELAEIYKVKPITIYRLLQGESWVHLNLTPKLKHTARQKLTDEDVRFIRTSKKNNADLALEFNCSSLHICRIKNFERRSNVK